MPRSTWLATCAVAALALALASPAAAQTSPQPAAPPTGSAAGTSASVKVAQAEAEGSTATPHYGAHGFDLQGRDLSVKPGDDFFRYANGGYLKTTEIPADRARFGNFDVLSVLSENRVRAILEEAAASHAPAGSAQAKIAAYWRAYMDAPRVEALGARPLQPDLARIRAATDRAAISELMGRHDGFFESVFVANVSPDAKNPAVYVVNMGTGGLGLPDKDYYLKPAFAAQKAAYQAYVARMLTLAGWPEPQARAADIVAFETRLAEASWDRAERRDRDKTYNPADPAQLAQTAPGFDWTRYLAASDLGQADRVILSDSTAFAPKARIFAETPVPVLQAWLAFNLADASAPYLSSDFVQARFEFRSKLLNGQPELPVRWKRAVGGVNGALGEAVGQIYVARYFPPEAKAQMLELVGNIKSALAARIQTLDWMSPETKQAAELKLSKFTVKIAYPDKWRDYSGLVVTDADLYGDAKRSKAFEWTYRARRLGGPVDRQEWGMTPQTVNAYYNSTQNEIVFPAAILAPPFFDPKADPAYNYGGIGGVIGHEISHGFDDQGRKSNGDGVLKDWWTPGDATAFKARTVKLGAQYHGFELLPGERINGDLTMGENIGDAGGINLALDAYHASLHGRPAPVVDGLTGDQRVFLGWAQVWRAKQRDAALVQQLHTDPHSPAEARVDAPVRNVDAWYAAFDVKPGDKLYLPPEERVHIW